MFSISKIRYEKCYFIPKIWWENCNETLTFSLWCFLFSKIQNFLDHTRWIEKMKYVKSFIIIFSSNFHQLSNIKGLFSLKRLWEMREMFKMRRKMNFQTIDFQKFDIIKRECVCLCLRVSSFPLFVFIYHNNCSLNLIKNRNESKLPPGFIQFIINNYNRPNHLCLCPLFW